MIRSNEPCSSDVLASAVVATASTAKTNSSKFFAIASVYARSSSSNKTRVFGIFIWLKSTGMLPFMISSPESHKSLVLVKTQVAHNLRESFVAQFQPLGHKVL